jgi:hypothetical protein
MTMVKPRHLLHVLFLAIPCALFAEPRPGDVFREYQWRPKGKWQRVTWPDVTEKRARAFLPNKVNTIALDDLEQAVKAEVYVEMLLCHGGTVDQKIRINEAPWIPIPPSPHIPGTAGTGEPACEYQYMRYPAVAVPLKLLRKGSNTFEFTCGPGSALGKWWPQWLLYGVTFRIYYDPSKPRPTGSVTAPAAGATMGDNARFAATAAAPAGIKQVDFIGRYDDFNWEGDGVYRQWHYRYLYGKIHNHMGSATAQPYAIEWDNRWIPTQQEPISVMARIVDHTNLCYLTPPVEGLKLARPYTVRMYKPYDVPKRWSTRAGQTHRCKTDVTGGPEKATAARVVMSTWNGVAGEDIGVNGTKVTSRIGKDHDLSYDAFPVPLELIHKGTNTLYTHSDTHHHGCEVQWPGMVLMVTYDIPEPGFEP